MAHRNRMNLGFLFLTYDDIIHTSTKQFIKNYSVYVNAKTPNKILNEKKYIISDHKTDWGSKNIADATVKMLETAYKNGHSWYILLAYDSLPLVRPMELESFLRFQTKSLFHLIQNNGKIWKTSQWWIMSRPDVKTVLENYERYDEYLQKTYHNKKIGAWDEIYFLSLLKFVDPNYVFRDYKTTYVRWLDNSVQKHPVTFGKLLETDIESSKKSFFIRKTTPNLTTKVYTPQKKLYIKVFGKLTNMNYEVPKDGDLMILSLVPNNEIPNQLLDKAIHIYFCFWEYININILEILDNIPTHLWEKIFILTEEFNGPLENRHDDKKISLLGIPRHISNPYQFYVYKDSLQKMAYEYSPNKIAFLFLTIGDINQPAIWTKYFEKRESKYSIYINPKHPSAIHTPWLKDRIIKKRVENTGWGFITEAYHNLLEEATQDPNNQKFVFISESCIPLKSFDTFYNTLMSDDIRTSYVKFMNMSRYDFSERIQSQDRYKSQGKFVKHYARMCLSRYHVEKLLKKDFTFFNTMHVGDEFFLTMIHPEPGKDFMRDFEITYDNWEDIKTKTNQLKSEIKSIYNKYSNGQPMSKQNQDTIEEKRAMRADIAKNPKTYTSITQEDIETASKKESFFWRKFTTAPLPPEVENLPFIEKKPVKQPTNNLKSRKQKNKNRKNHTLKKQETK